MPDLKPESKNDEIEEVAASEIRDRITDLMSRARYGGERFILTTNGKPSAALVSMRDLERLRALDADAA
jgi:prevent-host-death family protein